MRFIGFNFGGFLTYGSNTLFKIYIAKRCLLQAEITKKEKKKSKNPLPLNTGSNTGSPLRPDH